MTYEDKSNDSIITKDIHIETTSDNSSIRETWSHRFEFILSCLSYAVGLGNVWRFPYVCYKNGGGAFLLPFIIMLIITGLPLVFLELSFGQFASEGVVSIWKVSPMFKGIGWAMFFVSSLIACYYNMIIAWTLYYFFASFASKLPWSTCGSWSSHFCVENLESVYNCTQHKGIWFNDTCITEISVGKAKYNQIKNITKGNEAYRSASDEYFHVLVVPYLLVSLLTCSDEVLELTEGLYDLGGIKWKMAFYLLLAWIVVSICLAKGIKTSAKAAYFTAFFPYIVLFILLIRGVTLEGSQEGMKYYVTPQWESLGRLKVWSDAAVQVFFSLSPGWGGLITLASFNKFHNNCFNDAILITVLDCLTSIFAGLVIFAIIGYMAHELGQPVSTVATDGAGLAFVVYPEVVTKLPVSQLWSVLFFSMLFTLGLGTQLATVTTVHTTLVDCFPEIFRERLHSSNSVYLLIGIASMCYSIGLLFCTRGGMYVLQLFDNYAASYALLFIGITECLVLSWVYGSERFLKDICSMLRKQPDQKVWTILWKYISPISLIIILVFSWADFKRSRYGKVIFPIWADGLGWLISVTSILIVPCVAIFTVFREYISSNKPLKLVILKMSKPTKDWGPRLPENRLERFNLDEATAETIDSQAAITETSTTSQTTTQ